MKSNLFIYKGPGACPISIENAYKTCKTLYSGNISYITPDEIISGKLAGSHLIMPGGRDIPYTRSLKGEGCERIRSFVEAGGRYIGICAGSYFAGSRVSFDEGGPLEILGERELKFYSGIVKGPVYGTFDYYSRNGASAIEIEWEENLFVYFNGGGTFVGGSSKTLAYYPNKTPAIIEIDVGLGKAILSGVHFEFLKEDFDDSYSHIKSKLNNDALIRLQKNLLSK